MSEADDIELLYDVWEQNIETLRVLHRSSNERPGIVPTMVSHLRACAIDLVRRASNGGARPAPKGNGNARTKIDKSVLTISEPKRIRCKGASSLCRKSALPDLRTLPVGVLWVIVWFATASAYFALRGRQRLTLSPEEVFALQQNPGPAFEPARS